MAEQRSGGIRVDGRRVGGGAPTLLVAELSGNHNGDLERAVDTIHAAAEAGADAIKLQTYTADTLTIDSDRAEFLVPGRGPWGGRTLHDLYTQAQTPWEWHPRLFGEARRVGIMIFSTPFDETAVELLEELEVPAYKIASFELVDDELLRCVAVRGKPVILSLGMATLAEISHALEVLREGGGDRLVLLQCTSSYPAPDEEMHLSTIPFLAEFTGCPVGLSDHTLGSVAPVVAVALGACLIEKHFTLSRDGGGVDSHFSLEPEEFRRMVTEVRRAEAALGRPTFGPGRAEMESIVFRRSLFVVEDVREGEPLTRENVRSIRPGYGLPPRYLDVVLGARARRGIERGTPLTWDLMLRD
ncbi:MAG: pseudaminic acid synthase [Gemmatimonadota bacterium]